MLSPTWIGEVGTRVEGTRGDTRGEWDAQIRGHDWEHRERVMGGRKWGQTGKGHEWGPGVETRLGTRGEGGGMGT